MKKNTKNRCRKLKFCIYKTKTLKIKIICFIFIINNQYTIIKKGGYCVPADGRNRCFTHVSLILMTDKELQHLRRSELLEILLAQQKQIDSLKKELAEANEQLAERKIIMAKSGSIAEAALKLNGIFEAAQQAADQYLYSIGAAGEKGRVNLDGIDTPGETEEATQKKSADIEGKQSRKRRKK